MLLTSSDARSDHSHNGSALGPLLPSVIEGGLDGVGS